MDTLPWQLKYRAQAVAKILGKRPLGERDGRFRSGLNYELQEIYVAHSQTGIRLNAKALAYLWGKYYGDSHPLAELKRERSKLIKTQLAMAKRVKDMTMKIQGIESK